MQTLNNNYSRNLAILNENLRRGLSMVQATTAINGMESQFNRAGLYDDEAKQFISAMRQAVDDHFKADVKATDLMESLGVHVVRIG